MSELDARLRAHYARARLSEDSVQDLLAMHATAGERIAPARSAVAVLRLRAALAWQGSRRLIGAGPRRPGGVPGLRLAFGSVAVVLLALVLYRSGFQSGERLGSHAELGARTLREVALNHRTRFSPDYQDSSLAALDRRMALLPFALAPPERLSDALLVQGARYCSLAGQLAAHVTLRDELSGRPVSLFVTALERDVQGLDGIHGDLAGLDVQLWQEEGLFYAMARHE